MKRIIYKTLLFCTMLCMFSACTNDDNLFPEKYHKILYFKDNGIHNLSFNTTDQSPEDSILIIKAGSDPSLTANVSLKILTSDEVKDAFEESGGTNYAIIPSDAYKFSDGQEYKFLKNETYKYAPVVFDPIKIYQAIQTNKNATWVLPIQLSSVSDTINPEKNMILLKFNVKSPTIEWNISDQSQTMLYKTLSVNLSASMKNANLNEWTFTCGLDASENEKLVTAYNDSLGTKYEALPSGSYSFNNFAFSSGKMDANSILTINRGGLQNDHIYLLPLKLSSPSNDAIDKTDSIKYLIISNPKYGTVIPDRGTWKIMFCNSQPDGSASWNSLFYANKILDGDASTHWSTNYGSLTSYDDFRYDFPDFYAFKGVRNCPNIIIVIDMGEERSLCGVGLLEGPDYPGGFDLKSCNFYVSTHFNFKPVKSGGNLSNYNTVNDGNSWNFLINCLNIPQNTTVNWYSLSSTQLDGGVPRGRYLKFIATDSYRAEDLIELTELYVRQVVSVNGNPIN